MAHALFLSGKDDKDGELMNKLALINIETMKLAKKKGKFCTVVFQFKWRIFSQPGKIGTGKNTKSLFFLLALKYTLRTCFESKNFLLKSSEQSGTQFFSLSNLVGV